MKRRPHWFALTLWALSVLELLVGIPIETEMRRAIALSVTHNPDVVTELAWAHVWTTLQSTIITSSELFGLGVLIDIGDRIRASIGPTGKL
jgi:hypothetical protein